MGIYVNPGNRLFKEAVDSLIYVEQSAYKYFYQKNTGCYYQRTEGGVWRMFGY